MGPANDGTISGAYHVGRWGPAGDEPHHYLFSVYALDTESLGVDETTTYAKFRFLIRGHALASGTLTGRFGIDA